jgi:hypothetical protein
VLFVLFVSWRTSPAWPRKECSNSDPVAGFVNGPIELVAGEEGAAVAIGEGVGDGEGGAVGAARRAGAGGVGTQFSGWSRIWASAGTSVGEAEDGLAVAAEGESRASRGTRR